MHQLSEIAKPTKEMFQQLTKTNSSINYVYNPKSLKDAMKTTNKKYWLEVFKKEMDNK